MMDRNIPAVFVLNNKANMEMRADNPVLIEKDNTSKPTLVLCTQSIRRSLSNTQPGKKNETITERMKFIITIGLPSIFETKTTKGHSIKK